MVMSALPTAKTPRHRFGDELALIDEVALIVDCHDYRQRNTAGPAGGGAARATQRENGYSVHYGLGRLYARG
jgi:hypothetical protein